ncbi:MAG: hypothetical protein JWN44_3596, partial [Myxococcales bacterium]|nr:hypothetical protein [Myxococcales bacterium]
ERRDPQHGRESQRGRERDPERDNRQQRDHAAPRAQMQDPPTRGFSADGDDSTTNSSGGAGAEEEIAKILNETDVYIKYNLHAKAIEHLQRAFERNPRHVGAREKLKALYLILGKKDEAVLELWSLVENAEPGRKRRYLREILEIDPTNARAAGDLGEKLPQQMIEEATSGIDEIDMPPMRDPEGTGASEMLDVEDLEELSDDEFDVAAPSNEMPAQRASHRAPSQRRPGQPIVPDGFLEDDDRAIADEDDDEMIPMVVEPSRELEVQSASDAVEDRFGFDDGAEVEDRFGGFDDDNSGALPPTDSESHSIDEGVQAVEREVSREVSRAAPVDDDNDDADVHTRFDDQPLKFDHAALFGSGNDEIDEADLPPVGGLPGVAGARTQKGPQPSHHRRASDTDDEDDDALSAPSQKPITRTVQTPAALLDHIAPEDSGPVGSTLEDDLDEADFFVQQSLFEEARVILEQLLARHPSHPLVTAKLRDLEAMERAAGIDDASLAHVTASPGMTADMSAELPTELPGDVDAAPSVGDPSAGFEMTRKGVIEKGVTAEDFETHYDLGIAYKEMGLLDDAINEFRIVMKDPVREVQCHLMIGLCFLEKGMQTDAIGQFKKGLYVEGITDREALSMYFELGQAYERLNDPREALYYYDKVTKRDPHFRDVTKRVDALRGGTSPAQAAMPEGRSDDVDDAFDTLLGKDL